MNKKTIRVYSEDFFDLLLILIWGRDFLVTFAKAFVQHIPYIRYGTEIIMFFLYAGCALLAIPYISKKVKLEDLIGILVLQIFIVLHLMCFQENWEYLSDKLVHIFLVMIPLYFVGLRIDQDREINLLFWVSMVNIWLEIVYKFLFGKAMSGVASVYQGDMDLAYRLLPHVCMVMLYAMKKTNAINVISAIVGFFFVVICGTRGAMVIMIVFGVLYFVFLKTHKNPLATYSLLGGAGILAFVNMDHIFPWLYRITRRLGMSVRIFEKITNGIFWESKGRDVIRTQMIAAIQEKPILGYGIGADYTLCGSYAHNIALEFWISFGVVLGTIFLIAIAATVVRGFCSESNKLQKSFLLLMGCTVLLRLMVSGTYLDETCFFFLIGLCVGAVRRKNIKRRLSRMN